MINKKYIQLITMLEERGWEYTVDIEGKFTVILGNEELFCYKWEHESIQHIIEMVLEWQ